jgi:tRNA-splicing ligase RtcB
VWLVLHSGSRGIGNKLATMHITKARNLAKALELRLEDPDLAYFTEGTPEFAAYIADMLWAQDYARANRDEMMDNAMREVFAFLGFGRETQRINCHHNFTEREVHDGRELWMTRKGAIRADTGDLGVIPGSMGTRSYIVAGKGNAASWRSCSHGAGRRHSRTKAKKLFTTTDLAAQMAGKVWLSSRADALLDEIPAAYKDIDQVMADQADLVEVLHTLRQVLNYKGT